MNESKYLCTFDLFSSIPTLDESKTLAKEMAVHQHKEREIKAVTQINESSVCPIRHSFVEGAVS